jgi:hypothetical protein
MSPVTTIFYCVMNSVFLFFFCLNKLTKVNFPNEHVQLSDLIIIHQDRCYRRHIYMFYMSLLLPGLFFVVVHDLDLDLHEKINRNKRTRMVIIFFRRKILTPISVSLFSFLCRNVNPWLALDLSSLTQLFHTFMPII